MTDQTVEQQAQECASFWAHFPDEEYCGVLSHKSTGQADLTPMTRPYHCPICKDGEFYGKLLFENDEVPFCPNGDVKDEDGTVQHAHGLLVPA